MNAEDLLKYHSSRATQELDMGLTSDSLSASRSHLGLATLHFERVRQLAGASGEKILAPLRM